MRQSLAFLMLVMSALLSVPQAAHAEKPLMVVRFNQPNISYGDHLYRAVSRAVEAKPSVMFEVVSVVPQTADADTNADWKKVADAHAAKFQSVLQSMGVPASRISYAQRPQSGLRFDEVQLYVR